MQSKYDEWRAPESQLPAHLSLDEGTSASPPPQSLGVVGCGQMGLPIARLLLHAGYQLRVYDRDPGQTALLATSSPQVQIMGSPGATVEPAGIVLSMVPNDQALREVALGANGILARMTPGGIHVSCSTVSAALVEELEEHYLHKGCLFVCVTVSGRPDVAEAGNLSLFVAGERSAKTRLMSVFETLGRRWTDLGKQIAAPIIAKLAMNYLIVLNLVGLAAAADFVEERGLDRTLFLQEVAASPVFQGALFKQYGAEMIGPRRFQPALFPVALGSKDVALIEEETHRGTTVLPLLDVATESLRIARARGLGLQDWSALAMGVPEALRRLHEERLRLSTVDLPLAADPPAIDLRDVTKTYGSRTVLDRISLQVRRGEIFGLLGPNGSGKTTTINLLTGLSRPTRGIVQVLGADPGRQARLIRRNLGAVAQETALYEELTAWENLSFHADLFGLPRKTKKQRIEEILDLVQLRERRHSRVRTFSGGMKRRLALGRALLHQPELISLDEPTLGVDVPSRRALWEYIRQLRAQGTTILLTTNYLQEAEALCDRIAILNHGQIQAVDTPARLRERFGQRVLLLETDRPILYLEVLKAQSGVRAVAQEGTRLSITLSGDGATIPTVMTLVGSLAQILHLEIQESSLDEIFVTLTGASVQDETHGRVA